MTGLDAPGHSLSFEPSHNGVAGCNDKAYLQAREGEEARGRPRSWDGDEAMPCMRS